MSYVTQDRHGACTTHYATQKSTEVVGTGNTWWPDFGPGIRDYSHQPKYAPHEHIFEKVVKPAVVGKPRAQPLPERQPTQFRHPAPAREAMMMQDVPSHERRLVAKETTDKQAALRMLEVRQKRVDSWLEPAPIRMAAMTLPTQGRVSRSNSEPSLSSNSAAKASRDVYEKLGYLVGRSKGAIADGNLGARARRHNPLSFNALMFTGNAMSAGGRSRSSRSLQPRKPSKQWRILPESSFKFDPRTSLPVPRGGWDSQPPTSWPEPTAGGRREWVAPVTFDARRTASTMEALPEWPRSPSAQARDVTAGSAGSSLRKHPYAAAAEPTREWFPSDTQAAKTQ